MTKGVEIWNYAPETLCLQSIIIMKIARNGCNAAGRCHRDDEMTTLHWRDLEFHPKTKLLAKLYT